MGNEIIAKKIERIEELLGELEELLGSPFPQFLGDLRVVRSAERNFQLMVDLASDINTQIIVERGGMTPDTYRESFSRLQKEGVLSSDLTELLTESAKIRNILVHEYDFEEDYEKFYHSAKKIIPAYREYVRIIYAYTKR